MVISSKTLIVKSAKFRGLQFSHFEQDDFLTRNAFRRPKKAFSLFALAGHFLLQKQPRKVIRKIKKKLVQIKGQKCESVPVPIFAFVPQNCDWFLSAVLPYFFSFLANKLAFFFMKKNASEKAKKFFFSASRKRKRFDQFLPSLLEALAKLRGVRKSISDRISTEIGTSKKRVHAFYEKQAQILISMHFKGRWTGERKMHLGEMSSKTVVCVELIDIDPVIHSIY